MDEHEAQGGDATPESETPTETAEDPNQSSAGPGEGEANAGDPPSADEDGPQENGDEPQAAEAEPDPDSVTVTITKADTTSGVELLVNGSRFLLPIGKPVKVPSWVLPSLRATAGVAFTTG